MASQYIAVAMPAVEQARRPGNSERKRAADAACVAIVARSVPLCASALARAIEQPATLVCDMGKGAKPYPMRMLDLIDTSAALEMVEQWRDHLRAKLAAERAASSSHVTQLGGVVAPSQRVPVCAANGASGPGLRTAKPELEKSTMGQKAAATRVNGGRA